MKAATTKGNNWEHFTKRIIYLQNKIIDVHVKDKGYWEDQIGVWGLVYTGVQEKYNVSHIYNLNFLAALFWKVKGSRWN